jgi:hypothetical protein
MMRDPPMYMRKGDGGKESKTDVVILLDLVVGEHSPWRGEKG